MNVAFRYDFADDCVVPDDQLMGIYSPASLPQDTLREPREIIEMALANPIGSPHLKDLAKAGRTVTIIVDDMTRTTPTSEILDVLLPQLLSAGVRQEDITILLALGTHRDMTPAEIRDRLGSDLADSYRIVNHHARAESELVHCGTTENGTEAVVNRLAVESDLLIGCGHLVPHRIAGFSGGGKIVLPGISSQKCTGQMHWLSAKFKNEEINGRRDNPVRTEIDAVARMAGLRFILNVVQDGSGRIVDAVAGDVVEAHRAGTRRAERIYRVPMPELADIVITDSYPCDIDMWQAAKALFSLGLSVKPGGTAILVTPCPEGIAQTHPDVVKYGYARACDTVPQAVETGEITDMVAAAHLLEGGEVVDRARLILVSPGIPAGPAAALGMDWAPSPQAALDMAFDSADSSATVAVFNQIGELAPYVA